ncbi:MAG: L-rhamnose mutarotase [Rhizobiales bacterium 65-9]|nr:L-rhamnose mutarotase [Hyphomicrobiales bacterium]OJY34067.1 MAG: L-rhamnose mutarotase [Rhizobiales bacterium 65-9]
MQRVCFLLKVKRERLADYKAAHQNVWPEMLDALRAAGWRNYSLFLRDDGLLVGYFETNDLQQARARMAATDVNARWQATMAPYFEALDGRRPDEGAEMLTSIFHLA